MPEARDDHAYHGYLDVRPGLVEHEEVIAGATGDLDAGLDLLFHAVERDFHVERRRRPHIGGGLQERIVLQLQRRRAIERRAVAAQAAFADR